MRVKPRSPYLTLMRVLRIRRQICVPIIGDLIRLILEEAHYGRHSIHLRVVKKYYDLSQHYCWCCMKKDIPDFLPKCLTCEQVQCEHYRTWDDL